eukprot:403364299
MESGKPPMYIDPDLYIKISGEGDFENHYKCIICSGVVFDPVECKSCQNLYCKQCIDKSRNKCPNKCDNAQFQTIHRLLRNVLNKMTFRCQNYPRCFVQLKYDQYKQHYDKCIIKSLSALFEELQLENRALKGKSINQEKKLEEIEKRMADLELFCKESVINNSTIDDNFQQEEEEKLEKEQTDNSCDPDGRDIDSQKSRGGFEGRERPIPERPMRGFYRGCCRGLCSGGLRQSYRGGREFTMQNTIRIRRDEIDRTFRGGFRGRGNPRDQRCQMCRIDNKCQSCIQEEFRRDPCNSRGF